jgi:prevent-host-death family protein
MSDLRFRNIQGELVDIPTVAATRVKNEFGNILELATHGGAVAITKHHMPKAVLLSVTEFESLVRARSRTLEDLGGEFDEMLAQMQSTKGRKAMAKAFHATPDQIGRAAVKHARKKR